eukprot:CAMPEP_0184700050 /NCGR_PEP_ID=MMETSP0313-20130426/7737_1 /TAXON_ID=2792 /ORGANISM="Porphyridium aerugineum, Strain SAG 1380-2" /LENGTH=479 /DNA_ID=CAMNT_0027159411 /DNA_START=360 /DNA_END=1799 /DNA_ORIENTATION=-
MDPYSLKSAGIITENVESLTLEELEEQSVRIRSQDRAIREKLHVRGSRAEKYIKESSLLAVNITRLNDMYQSKREQIRQMDEQLATRRSNLEAHRSALTALDDRLKKVQEELASSIKGKESLETEFKSMKLVDLVGKRAAKLGDVPSALIHQTLDEFVPLAKDRLSEMQNFREAHPWISRSTVVFLYSLTGLLLYTAFRLWTVWRGKIRLAGVILFMDGCSLVVVCLLLIVDIIFRSDPLWNLRSYGEGTFLVFLLCIILVLVVASVLRAVQLSLNLSASFFGDILVYVMTAQHFLSNVWVPSMISDHMERHTFFYFCYAVLLALFFFSRFEDVTGMKIHDAAEWIRTYVIPVMLNTVFAISSGGSSRLALPGSSGRPSRKLKSRNQVEPSFTSVATTASRFFPSLSSSTTTTRKTRRSLLQDEGPASRHYTNGRDRDRDSESSSESESATSSEYTSDSDDSSSSWQSSSGSESSARSR